MKIAELLFAVGCPNPESLAAFLENKAILKDGTIRRIKEFTSVTSPFGEEHRHDGDFIDLEDPEEN